MTQLASDLGPGRSPDIDVPFAGFEVATTSADTLRAAVRVTGTLDPNTAALLTSVVRTHVAAGRRYLSLDLGHAVLGEPPALDCLIEADHAVAALGGTVVFDNADPRVIDAIHAAPRP